jgi:hypothetical protein
VTDGGRHPLLGGWRLRSWVSIADDGSEVLPMGETPDGLLTYTADGTMIGIMGPPHLYKVNATGVVEFFISQVGRGIDMAAGRFIFGDRVVILATNPQR